MTIQNLVFATEMLIFVLAIVAIIYTLGVVWRVEKKLDLAFKLFFISVIFFFISQIIKNIPMLFCCLDNSYFELAVGVAKLLFAAFFLAGMLEMRSMIQKMDGEK
ncbi:MAG: hypothetical protein V1690_01130 [Candidatus Moraniibacteriota bacterium]